MGHTFDGPVSTPADGCPAQTCVVFPFTIILSSPQPLMLSEFKPYATNLIWKELLPSQLDWY